MTDGTGTIGPIRCSVTEAAAILGITDRGVRKRLAAGTLAGERVGGVWVVTLDARRNPEPEPSARSAAEPERSAHQRSRGSGADALRAAYQRDARIAVLEAENRALRDELEIRRGEMQTLIATLAEQAETLRSVHAPAIPAAIIETASYAPGAPQRTETARSATNPAPVDNLTLNATPEVERQPAPGRWDRLVEGVRGLVGRGQ